MGDHLLTEPAQVFILTGDQPRRSQRPVQHAADGSWGLWAVHSGAGRLLPPAGGGDPAVRVLAPALVCLHPGSDRTLELPPAVDYRMLRFTVRWRPRRCVDPGWEAWADRRGQQPDAQTWFGRSLPLLVESPQRDSGLRMVAEACREWWLGDLRRLRASAWLAAWLYDWLCALERRDGADGWAALATLAEERLAKGFGVADLASHCGLSRSQLFRRMRAELGCGPQEWLADIRRDRARRLLAAGHDRVAVARQCGYRSGRTFARWARREGLIG